MNKNLNINLLEKMIGLAPLMVKIHIQLMYLKEFNCCFGEEKWTVIRPGLGDESRVVDVPDRELE